MIKVGLFGYGRFGKLLYEQLKKHVHIAVYEPVRRPAEQGDPEFLSLEKICRNNLIILAVPVSVVPQISDQISGLVAPGTIIMDVCAVKQYPLSVLQEKLPPDIQIFGSHPLFGPDSVQDSMEGHVMITSPVRISSHSLKMVQDFWQGFGIRLVEMTPQEHDRLMAWTLGLTHFLGRGLKHLPLPATDVATRDYQNLIQLMEKINRDTWELFLDMQRYNPFTADMRRKLIQSLNNLKDELDEQESDSEKI